MIIKELFHSDLSINAELVLDYLTRRLRDYVIDKSRRDAVIVGVSGGVDSSLVAYLAIKAIGAEHSYFYMLPSASTPKEDMEDAYAVLQFSHANRSNTRIIPIDDIVAAFEDRLSERLDRVAIGNIKARVRMTMLHSFATIHNGLVLGTGDKSEITMGYFTKFGDGGVDVLPLGDLYKSQVRELAAFIGLPPRVYTKPPSPALWEGQSAEDELGIDYLTLDRILRRRFDLWHDERDIATEIGLDEETIKRIVGHVKSTQHKRYPPEIFRLSFRSHGSDWRYPREWG